MAARIVDLAEISREDLVVEIGPGLGSLTCYLAGRGGRLVALEKDAAMVGWLKQKFGSGEVELFHVDALEFDLRELWGWGPAKIVGNLPYYISTPLIAKYTSALSPASMLVLTLQHEVAARLAANISDPDYGAMSVCVQRHWKVELARKLPASVFYPAPKVSSSVVRLTPRSPDRVVPLDEQVFEALVRKGFGERRKQLKNLLPAHQHLWPEFCRVTGLPETARAENLDLEEWEQLARMATSQQAQKPTELFDVVDGEDRVIGPKPREFVHVNNLRHRAVHILLFNDLGEIFLQRRSPWKDKNPDLWDSSAAGHVDAGETYLQAAIRELEEELGVGCALELLGKIESCAATAWEFVEVFRGLHDGPFRLAPMEVAAGAFFPLGRVAEWLTRRPGDFTPLFRWIFPRFIFKSCVEPQPRYE